MSHEVVIHIPGTSVYLFLFVQLFVHLSLHFASLVKSTLNQNHFCLSRIGAISFDQPMFVLIVFFQYQQLFALPQFAVLFDKPDNRYNLCDFVFVRVVVRVGKPHIVICSMQDFLFTFKLNALSDDGFWPCSDKRRINDWIKSNIKYFPNIGVLKKFQIKFIIYEHKQTIG